MVTVDLKVQIQHGNRYHKKCIPRANTKESHCFTNLSQAWHKQGKLELMLPLKSVHHLLFSYSIGYAKSKDRKTIDFIIHLRIPTHRNNSLFFVPDSMSKTKIANEKTCHGPNLILIWVWFVWPGSCSLLHLLHFVALQQIQLNDGSTWFNVMNERVGFFFQSILENVSLKVSLWLDKYLQETGNIKLPWIQAVFCFVVLDF